MADPKTCWDARVSKEVPQLVNRADANGSDSEEADPFRAEDCTKTQSRQCQPRPPTGREWFLLVFVAESAPEEDSEGGKEHERRVEEDMTRLSDQAVFEGDKH